MAPEFTEPSGYKKRPNLTAIAEFFAANEKRVELVKWLLDQSSLDLHEQTKELLDALLRAKHVFHVLSHPEESHNAGILLTGNEIASANSIYKIRNKLRAACLNDLEYNPQSIEILPLAALILENIELPDESHKALFDDAVRYYSSLPKGQVKAPRTRYIPPVLEKPDTEGMIAGYLKKNEALFIKIDSLLLSETNISAIRKSPNASACADRLEGGLVLLNMALGGLDILSNVHAGLEKKLMLEDVNRECAIGLHHIVTSLYDACTEACKHLPESQAALHFSQMARALANIEKDTFSVSACIPHIATYYTQQYKAMHGLELEQEALPLPEKSINPMPETKDTPGKPYSKLLIQAADTCEHIHSLMSDDLIGRLRMDENYRAIEESRDAIIHMRLTFLMLSDPTKYEHNETRIAGGALSRLRGLFKNDAKGSRHLSSFARLCGDISMFKSEDTEQALKWNSIATRFSSLQTPEMKQAVDAAINDYNDILIQNHMSGADWQRRIKGKDSNNRGKGPAG